MFSRVLLTHFHISLITVLWMSVKATTLRTISDTKWQETKPSGTNLQSFLGTSNHSMFSIKAGVLMDVRWGHRNLFTSLHELHLTSPLLFQCEGEIQRLEGLVRARSLSIHQQFPQPLVQGGVKERQVVPANLQQQTEEASNQTRWTLGANI